MASLGINISRSSSSKKTLGSKKLSFASKLSSSSSATGSKGGNGSSLTSSSASGLFDEHGLFVMKGTCDSWKKILAFRSCVIGRAALALCFVRKKRKVLVPWVAFSLSHARVACAACPVGGLYTLARFFSDVLNI